MKLYLFLLLIMTFIFLVDESTKTMFASNNLTMQNSNVMHLMYDCSIYSTSYLYAILIKNYDSLYNIAHSIEL